MREKITITILLISAVVMGFAKQPEQSVIRKVALGFYLERSGLTEGLTYNSIAIREITPTMFNNRVVYYTLTINPRGWIVISADDVVAPVLAYSFEDNMNTASLPPQFISWMDKYKKQINDAISRDLPASEKIKSDWARYTNYTREQPLTPQLLTGVSPLIIHNWDQGFPYNIYCPQDPAGPGNHPYAGCVATAMCQLMYYYRFPLTGNGQHCYTPGGYPQQCADYGATSYDWNAMVNSLTGARLDNDSAVALLLWHAGVSVNMMYSSSGSGAYSNDARNAMVNNFRFSPAASYIHRNDFQVPAWGSILRSNLDKKMPVYYDGYGPQGGHAFNCDGYQGSDHFHFNWGWSGTANGYFYLDNLNPAGDNFSQDEGAIVNLFPDTVANTYPYPCQTQTLLHSISGTFDDGSGPALNYHGNSQCSWLLKPQNTQDSVQSITIAFNTFSTLPGSGIVRIYKGEYTSDSLAGEYSGDALPASLSVNGPKALVTFTSGSGGAGPGWLITYTGKAMDWCKDIQTLTDTTGMFSDGSLHFNYHNSTTCRWKILPTGNSGPLNLSFNSFRTQQNHDYIQIFDYGTGEPLAEYSGLYTGTNVPGPVTANSGQMFIIFSTDQAGSEAGWEAVYSTALGCKDNTAVPEVQIYPNPVRDYLYISHLNDNSGELQVVMNDLNGLQVISGKFSAERNLVRIDVSSLKSGMYFLRITSANGSVVKKVVKE